MVAVLSRIGTATRTPQVRIMAFYKEYALVINLGALLTLFVVVAFWQWITVVVPAGHVGVKWYRFIGGTDTETVYAEGNHFILPWDKMAIYDARLQQINRDFDVLTRDGLTMTVNIAFRYQLNDATVGQLHKHVGSEYLETILVPIVGSYARSVFSQNSTDEIYTDRRMALQGEIKQAVVAELDHNLGQADRQRRPWLFLDDVLIRGMRFPPEVQSAINRKMEQYQLKQEYTYRLQREELESQRKEVEARGIALFQSIVGAGISDTYLRWKGIDATLALAQSPNAKIVVIGAAKDGMPLILGGADTPPSVPSTRGEAGSAAIPEAMRKAEVPLTTLPPLISGQQSISPEAPVDPLASEGQTTGLDEGIGILRTKARMGRPGASDVLRAPSSASGSNLLPSSVTTGE